VGIVARSQYLEEAALLRHKIDELSTNTVILIARAEKLIQESEKLSARVKALETPQNRIPRSSTR
jgi:outer membrane murein-binding lipoprotein Lpp